MPCDSGGGPIMSVADEIVSRLNMRDKKLIKAANEQIKQIKEELDLVTSLLCGILRENPKLANKSLKLAAWWKKHQAWDRKNGR